MQRSGRLDHLLTPRGQSEVEGAGDKEGEIGISLFSLEPRELCQRWAKEKDDAGDPGSHWKVSPMAGRSSFWFLSPPGASIFLCPGQV